MAFVGEDVRFEINCKVAPGERLQKEVHDSCKSNIDKLEDFMSEPMSRWSDEHVKRIHNLLSEMDTADLKTLERILSGIFDWVQDERISVVMSRCLDTFANMILCLREKFADDSSSKVAFTRVLLNVIQDRFEDTLVGFADGVNVCKTGKGDQIDSNKRIAVVHFIGHLYECGLVATRVPAQVMHDLIGHHDRQPDEQLIICACEFMHCVQKKMNEKQQGRILYSQFLGRLSNLAASRRSPDSPSELLYSKSVLEAVRGVQVSREQRYSKESKSPEDSKF